MKCQKKCCVYLRKEVKLLMRQNTRKAWSQMRTAQKLRKLERNIQKRDACLEEQIVLLNSKMDKVLGLLENMWKVELNSVGSKLDEGIKLQAEDKREILGRVQELQALLKRLDDDNVSRQEKDFEQLQDLMKLVLANELIKPMVSEFG